MTLNFCSSSSSASCRLFSMAFATFVTGGCSLGMNGRKIHRKWPRIPLFFGSTSSSRSLASKSICLEEIVRAMFCDRKIGGEEIFPAATKFHRQILVSQKKKICNLFLKMEIWKFLPTFLPRKHMAHSTSSSRLVLIDGCCGSWLQGIALSHEKHIFHWLFNDRILIMDYYPHITGYNPLSPLNNQGLFCIYLRRSAVTCNLRYVKSKHAETYQSLHFDSTWFNQPL